MKKLLLIKKFIMSNVKRAAGMVKPPIVPLQNGTNIMMTSTEFTKKLGLGSTHQLDMLAASNAIGRIITRHAAGGSSSEQLYYYTIRIYEPFTDILNNDFHLGHHDLIDLKCSNDAAKERNKANYEKFISATLKSFEDYIEKKAISDNSTTDFDKYGPNNRHPFMNRFVQPYIEVDEDRIIKYHVYDNEEVWKAVAGEGESGNFFVYLPIEWVAPGGIELEHLLQWIDFINALKMGPTLEYLRTESCNEDLRYPSKKSVLQSIKQGMLSPQSINPRKILRSNDCYVVKLETVENGLINHYVMILLQCIYMEKNICWYCLKTKAELPTENIDDILVSSNLVGFRGSTSPILFNGDARHVMHIFKTFRKSFEESINNGMVPSIFHGFSYRETDIRNMLDMLDLQDVKQYFLTYKKLQP